MHLAKTILTLSIIFLLQLNTYATNVSGLITTNTTWTKANSPYIITNNTAVEPNVTLTIEPGVEVRFDGDYFMDIHGTIIALGTITDTILFTYNKTTTNKYPWKGVKLTNNAQTDTTVFKYCHFRYADKAIASNHTVLITKCLFNNNGTGFQNLDFPNSFVIVDSCSFMHNEYGMFLAGGGYVTNCDFYSNGRGYRISANKSHFCANNIFHKNVYGLDGGSISTIVHNNIFIENYNYGIAGGGDIKYNQFWSNGTGLLYRYGDVEFNGFKYNNVAIEDIGDPTNYSIRNNCFEKSITHTYINKNATDKDISGNYWGVTDSTIIDTMIVDYYDNLTSGRVSFMPVLNSKDTNCADTIIIPNRNSNPPTWISEINDSNYLSVYPNPAKDQITFKSSTTNIKTILFYNITGQPVFRTNRDEHTSSVSISDLVPGNYFYKVTTENGQTMTGKFIKK